MLAPTGCPSSTPLQRSAVTESRRPARPMRSSAGRSSTALSLLVVPVVFTYVDTFRRKAAALSLWIALRKSLQ